MRIAQVLHGWPAETMGGTGMYVEALSRGLTALGHEVRSFAPGQGAPVRTPRRWEETWRHPALSATWRAWLRHQCPDVVHIHHLAHLSLDLPQVAQELGIPVVMTLHDHHLACARGQLVNHEGRPCDGPEPQRCATCLGPHLHLDPLTKTIGDWLGSWPSLRGRIRDRLPPPTSRAADRTAARMAAAQRALLATSRILSPSRDLADRMEALGWPRPELTDLPLVRPITAAPPPPPGPVRFLFASTMIPTKGPGRLLAAFQALPAGSATLTLAGPTPAFDGHPNHGAKLEAEARQTPGVRWCGAVPGSQINALFAEHDVLVLPSIWPENSPLVVREASAAGLRLILPGTGGARELAPEAPAPTTDAQLLEALIAEVRRGRGRVPPRTWPTPTAHAERLIGEVYGPLVG